MGGPVQDGTKGGMNEELFILGANVSRTFNRERENRESTFNITVHLVFSSSECIGNFYFYHSILNIMSSF